jgi:hypothetical protein
MPTKKEKMKARTKHPLNWQPQTQLPNKELMMRLLICFSLAVVTLLSAFANAQAAPHEHCWWHHHKHHCHA